MSLAILQLTQSRPIISTIALTGITGDSLLMVGDNFKFGITQVSGQDTTNNSSYFNLYGEYKQNISGLNNTIDENSILFTVPSGIQEGANYQLTVFNQAGSSTNNAYLKIIGKPSISGIDIRSGVPDDYIRISGKNFNPAPDFTLIDTLGNRTKPDFISDLYSISSVDITSYGTGYQTGDFIIISGQKPLSSKTYGLLQIAQTGISGSAGAIEIINSGIFTVPFDTNLDLKTSGQSGDGLNFNLIYNNYSSGNFDYLEFQVPYNVKKLQSGLVENLRYKENLGSVITGFNVLGIPEIYTLSSLTGTVDTDKITISGENLNFVSDVFIGNFGVEFSGIDSNSLNFNVDNFAETNFITVSGKYGSSTNSSLFNVSYPPIIASGFNPQDVLIGTGAVINISGKYLQRLNYLNLGQPNILKKYITITNSGKAASFNLPNELKTTEVLAYSVDFPSSGTTVLSPSTSNKLIISQRLNTALLNFDYTSGINAARYLDEIEFFTPDQYTGDGDFGNINNSDIFFLSPTGYTFITGSFNRSGIKVSNTPGSLRIKVPREVDNPICPIKIIRNKFKDQYILPSNKFVNILPTIFAISSLNTLSGSGFSTILPGSLDEGGASQGSVNVVTDGFIKISGINASNATKLVFSGYSGNLNLFGYKRAPEFLVLETASKDTSQIEGISGDHTGYTIFTSQLGGDYTGSGQAFLTHPLYGTGYGYENYNITKLTGVNTIKVYPVSGYRPTDSFIFTSAKTLAVPLDEPFEYTIQTNTFATKFEISPTTAYGWGPADWPSGYAEYVYTGVQGGNKIAGIPWWGRKYWVKIRALDGDQPNEAMSLELAFGVSGRSLAGPGVIYRGDWETGVVYVGNQLRRDLVKYTGNGGGNYWYATQTSSGITYADAPGPFTINWLRFDAEFSAVATKILLAEESNITTSLNIGVYNAKTGVIKSVNDVNFNFGSGFFLGYDTSLGSINPELPKMRVGNTDEGYLKWDGQRLSILGSLSGVVTSSKNVKDAQNIVDAEYSVAIGLKNTIPSNSINSFIFGDSHKLDLADKSSIIGGKNNIITGTQSFVSTNSNIAGGENNYILGSFSNIMGGKGNLIQTISTGTSNITMQCFNYDSEDISLNTIPYSAGFFTDNLALLTSYEKSGDLNFFDIDSYDIEASRVKVKIPDILTEDDRNFKLNVLVSTYSNNLFSGTYRNNSIGFCQFKTFKSGILSGNSEYRINYPTPFTGIGFSRQKQDIVVLSNLQNQNFYNAIVTGVDATGFNLLLNATLKENVTGTFFAASTGNFTGLGLNVGQMLQIRSIFPFRNVIDSGNFTGTFSENLFKSVSDDNTLKVFGRASNANISGQLTDQNFYYSKKSHNRTGHFVVDISSNISGLGKLTGIKYEYIATNIDLDKQSAVLLQGDDIYGKFADFSFSDIGSSTIGGGTGNLIRGSISYIGAGVNNTIIGDYDVIPGGRNNKIVDTDSPDVSLADFSAILGGKDNTITGHVTEGIILGGKNNTIINANYTNNFEIDSATIINGDNNRLSGNYSTIINGQNNTISGDYNYTLGNNIKIAGSGCIVVRDLTNGNLEFSTTVDNAMYLSYKTIILDINKIPTDSAQVPVSGLYRNGTFLQIRLS